MCFMAERIRASVVCGESRACSVSKETGAAIERRSDAIFQTCVAATLSRGVIAGVAPKARRSRLVRGAKLPHESLLVCHESG